MPVFAVGFIVGAAVAGAISIVFPSRRVRRERPIDDEVETRILLGLEPEPEAETALSPPAPREYDTSQLAQLRELDRERRGPTQP